jgi:hypothetical protein
VAPAVKIKLRRFMLVFPQGNLIPEEETPSGFQYFLRKTNILFGKQ